MLFFIGWILHARILCNTTSMLILSFFLCINSAMLGYFHSAASLRQIREPNTSGILSSVARLKYKVLHKYIELETKRDTTSIIKQHNITQNANPSFHHVSSPSRTCCSQRHCKCSLCRRRSKLLTSILKQLKNINF